MEPGHTFKDTDLAGLPSAGYFRVSSNPDETEQKSVNDQETEYLAWVKRGNKWVPIVLCVAAALFFQVNVQIGQRNGELLRQRHEAIAADAREGQSAEAMRELQPPPSRCRGLGNSLHVIEERGGKVSEVIGREGPWA